MSYRSPLGPEYQYGMGTPPEIPQFGESPQLAAYDRHSGQDDEDSFKKMLAEYLGNRYGGGQQEGGRFGGIAGIASKLLLGI